MRDSFSIKDIKGHVTMLGREKGGNWFVIKEINNALIPNSKEIIAKALAAQTGWLIDSIKAMKASAVLATGNTSASFPASNQVQFQTLFDFSDFNDTLDEVRLSSALGGDFSVVTGLSVTKTNLLQLNMKWVLTIL